MVDGSVSQEEGAALGVEDMERGKVLKSGLNTNHFFSNLHRVATAGKGAGDKGIGFAGFHHHHTEIVAVEHFFGGFGEVDAIALMLIHVEFGIACASMLFSVVSRVHDSDALDVEVEFFGALGNHFLVAQQDGEAHARFVSLHGSLEHIVGIGLCKHHALG